ncbi:MAG: DNA topoisomerase IB [Candidatus Eremiobacteraeota bacterium]|nr:DNA topoisomerase IB [Candidatus Eremiobacteraeota bacterium]
MPGITRKKAGKHFAYFSPDGKKITDKSEIARINSLAVPPAYTDVWICPAQNGHIQATGRDARGRKQYRYHTRWREVRDENKYNKMIAFAQALPKVRKTVEEHLKLPELPREKILATIVQLLETTTIRIGNEEYAKENKSYGLTTLKESHAKVEGSKVQFSFRGKSGIRHAISLQDRRLAKIIRACQDLPGQQLFGYVDENGETHAVDSSDVNDYIRQIAGEEFSAKDFRTWVGTVTCALLLREDLEIPETQTDRKKRIKEAIKDVAARLGNTPTVCKKCYVHPEVVAAYLEGEINLKRRMRHVDGLLDEERFVLALLEARTAETPDQKTVRQLKRSINSRKKSAA